MNHEERAGTKFDASSVRIAVLGVGQMGARHARKLWLGEVRGATLAAVCDPEQGALRSFAGVPRFEHARELFASGMADAVLIATPHRSHAPLTIEALNAGLHVLCEKPLAVHVAEAAKMIAAHEQSAGVSRVFAAMFNLRAEPRFIELRRLIRSGSLGAPRRVDWVVTDCFRSEAYYRACPWRGAFASEGGGVLLNQSPHPLDIWQWLFGMPTRVHAFCGFGRGHEIEGEDQVTAYLEYTDGLYGSFVTSTAESPGSNRLEIALERGKLLLEQGELQLTRNAVSSSEFVKSAALGSTPPAVATERIALPAGGDSRTLVIQNFVNAIREGEALIAPAAEGLASLELANAMIYSGLTRRTVELPLDPALYLGELARKSPSFPGAEPGIRERT